MSEHDENRDAYRELILEKIENLHCGIEDHKKMFATFTKEIWPIIETHSNKLVHLETSLGIMAKIMWLVVAASISCVVGVFWKIVLK